MELRDDPVIQSAGRALAEAARSMGDVHVQNRATIGGHLATANPAADLAAAIVVLGASIHVASTYRVRVISAADFFTGPFDTSLEENEIITEITFPVPPPRTGGAYEKVKNPASGHPICGVAALVTLSPAGRIGICRVAVTGVTSHPARLRVVEATLEGAEPSAASVRAATSHATKDLTLISDRVASSAFRAHLTTVLTEQAIHRAISRAV
jgi:carbon-monoxide dehydrogenase medium subunit